MKTATSLAIDHLNIAEERLIATLKKYAPLAIAVSGGIDSLTLASVAHRSLATKPLMIHALSPSVPFLATQRVREMAAKEGWDLNEVSAGEFDNPDYLANPINRCYFCKSSLYETMRKVTDFHIASGANLDDLSDYRPGLVAAKENQVIHPFIEAKIDKACLRQLARRHHLDHYAELPAQPCLSSRVETGVPIKMADLHFIDQLEGEIRTHLGDLATIRVRMRSSGVAVELGKMPEQSLLNTLEITAKNSCDKAGYAFTEISAYRQGSAFIGLKVASA